MKSIFFKILPIALGAGLGWLIFNPPDWPAPSGPAGFLLGGAIILGLLVVTVVLTVAASLPKEITLVPYGGPADPSMDDLVRQITGLGFVEAGGPWLVGIRPPAVLRAFVHAREPVYATVFRTGTLPQVTSCDFVSVFAGSGGGLTTGTNWRAGTMPSGPGEFRQILPGAGPREAFEAHGEGLRWLSGRGLPARNATAETFAADFKAALGRQRRMFLSAPFRNALTALLRTVTKRVPETGLLPSQKNAEARVRERLSAGKS